MSDKRLTTNNYAANPNRRYAPKPDRDETAELMRRWNSMALSSGPDVDVIYDESGVAVGEAGKLTK